MILDDSSNFERFYDPDHMAEVLADMLENFDRYFKTFAPTASELATRLNKHITEFLDEQSRYQPVLDIGFLYDCDEDPGTFKNIFKSRFPIVRRCLNSPSKLMDGYRRDFYRTASHDMLETVINIVEFAKKYKNEMDPELQTLAKKPHELDISVLDQDGYGTSGVIGGGIRSNFLFYIAPDLFPNRSQNAIWAYYFLSGRKDYGFKDYSEFLMVDATGGKGTQQNYYYRYDLFTWYGLQISLKLQEECRILDYPLTSRYRYIYLDAFLVHVANVHEADINTLRPQLDEKIYY